MLVAAIGEHRAVAKDAPVLQLSDGTSYICTVVTGDCSFAPEHHPKIYILFETTAEVKDHLPPAGPEVLVVHVFVLGVYSYTTGDAAGQFDQIQ